MNGFAARVAMGGLVMACFGTGAALSAANKPDPKLVWPKDNRFICRGILTEDQGSLMLAPDQNMLTWCDAEIGDRDKSRVLKACKLGDRCEIKGSIRGHGTFGWVEINSVVPSASPR